MVKQFKSIPVQPSEITPEHMYRSRRQFLKAMGIFGLGAMIAACAPTPISNKPSADETKALTTETPTP